MNKLQMYPSKYLIIVYHFLIFFVLSFFIPALLKIDNQARCVVELQLKSFDILCNFIINIAQCMSRCYRSQIIVVQFNGSYFFKAIRQKPQVLMIEPTVCINPIQCIMLTASNLAIKEVIHIRFLFL